MRSITSAQKERQDYRENGKYARVNPCYVCGKSAGVNYYSHQDTDGTIGDELLILCKKCGAKLGKFPGNEAVEVAFGMKGASRKELEEVCFNFAMRLSEDKEDKANDLIKSELALIRKL